MRFFNIFGAYFLPKAYFLPYPNGPYPLYYIHPCLDQKENLFLFLKKQEPVSIALSTSSSFFGLSLLARLVPMDSVLKSSILIVQRLALHQNGVEFRQQFNGAIRTSLSAPYANVGRRARLWLNKLRPYFLFGDCFIVT